MSSLAVIPRDWNYPIRESRSSLENPQTPLSYPAEWLLDIFNGGRTDSGIRVSELTAFQTTTFLSCVDLISSKIAALPRRVQQRTVTASGRAVNTIAYDHELYDLLTVEPNPEMNGNTMFKAFICHCLAWGNGYIEIQRDAAGRTAGVWPRNPSKTRPRRILEDITLPAVPWRPYPVVLLRGMMAFQTTDMHDEDESSGTARIIPMRDMIHVPGLAFDGRVGQSTVWLARQTIGLALATEKFGAKYFSNFARPGGILKMPMNLTPSARDEAKKSWREAQGGENSQGVAVMPPGFEWQSITNTPEQSQAVDTRKFIRNEICSIFHVPPHMVGDVDKSKANTEQLAQELKEYCLDPWMSSIMVEIKRKLFPHAGLGRTPRNNYFMDFDLKDLLRPDAASREKFYASGRQWGYLRANDVLAMENMNPLDDPMAETTWMPVNMTLTDTPMDPTHQDGAGNGEVPPDPNEPPNKKKKVVKDYFAYGYSRLFDDAFRRILRSHKRDEGLFKNCFGSILFAIRDVVKAEACDGMCISMEDFPESDKYIANHLTSMAKRGMKWSAESTEVPAEELDKAIQAIRICVYREVAAEKAGRYSQ